MDDIERFKKRKGATSTKNILSDVLSLLNEGRLETLTLSEWLAVDQAALLGAVLPDLGLGAHVSCALTQYKGFSEEGITKRFEKTGVLLFDALKVYSARDKALVLNKLAAHDSDIVRAWTLYIYAADDHYTLAERLDLIKPFADDHNMAVRECAWLSVRHPYLSDDIQKTISFLARWIIDPSENIRRFAIEAIRPCGVWTAHLTDLKSNPEAALCLLEPVKADPSRYVQNATANWLNDASKYQPEWVEDLCGRWTKESPTPETAYIVKRALRTLRKKRGASS